MHNQIWHINSVRPTKLHLRSDEQKLAPIENTWQRSNDNKAGGWTYVELILGY